MSFREVLQAYGVDVQPTMERLANSEDLYRKCLDIFLKDSNIEKLQTALKNGDWKAGFEAAHALKGVSANLGLQPFLDKICLLVEPLRVADAQADYPALLDAVMQEWEAVKGLKTALG